MKTIASKIKLKPNSLGKVEDWSKELNARKEEVLATLRDEAVLFESAFLDQVSEDEAYLIYVMIIEDIEQCKKAAQISTHPIDAYHQQFKKDTWDTGKSLETLISFNTFEEKLK